MTLDCPGALVLDPDLAVSATEGLAPHPDLDSIYGQRMEDERLIGGFGEKMAETDPGLALERHENFHQMDLTHVVCDPESGICPTTAGSIHLWIDSSHLSASGMFSDELFEATGWAPAPAVT